MIAYQFYKLRLILAILLILVAGNITQINAIAQSPPELTSEQYQQISDQIQQLLTQAQQEYQTGNQQRAIATINQALTLTQQFSGYDQADQVVGIITNFGEWGDTITALEILKPFQQKNATDTYFLSIYDQLAANLVIKLVSKGELDTAETWSQTIVSPYPQAQALNAIATQLINQQQTAKASQILEQTTKIAENINESYESNGSCANYRFEILSQIAANLSKLAQLEQALAIAQNLESCSSASGESGENYQENAFIAIIQPVTTIEQLELIWKTAQKITQNLDQLPVWSAIALKYIQLGQTDRGFAIAQTISQQIPTITKIESGADYRAVGVKEQALRDISLALAKSGNSQQALNVANMIEPPTKAIQEFLGDSYPNWREQTLQELQK